MCLFSFPACQLWHLGRPGWGRTAGKSLHPRLFYCQPPDPAARELRECGLPCAGVVLRSTKGSGPSPPFRTRRSPGRGGGTTFPSAPPAARRRSAARRSRREGEATVAAHRRPGPRSAAGSARGLALYPPHRCLPRGGGARGERGGCRGVGLWCVWRGVCVALGMRKGFGMRGGCGPLG